MLKVVSAVIFQIARLSNKVVYENFHNQATFPPNTVFQL
jgi:hypothetical protein